MYTLRMHERIKKITDKYYGQSVLTEAGLSLGRELTFADIADLLYKIEEMQEELDNVGDILGEDR